MWLVQLKHRSSELGEQAGCSRRKRCISSEGGGIFNADSGFLDVKNSDFSQNRADLGSDIYNASTVPVQIKHTGITDVFGPVASGPGGGD